MVDSLIAFIDPVTYHLEALCSQEKIEPNVSSQERFITSYKLRIGLKKLKLSLLCLRMLGEDDTHLNNIPNLKDILSNVKDVLGSIKKAESIHSILDWYLSIQNLVSDLDGKINADLLTDTSAPCSLALTAYGVAVITELIADTLLTFIFYIPLSVPGEVKGREVLDTFEGHMRFLRNFMLFAICVGVGDQQMGNLLIHIEPIVINATRVFATSSLDECEIYNELISKCSTVDNMTIDPKVYHAYTQVLINSTLHMQSQYPIIDTVDTYNNFLDSLLSIYWDVLRVDSSHLDSLKHRLKVVYEKLRCSRSILKQRPTNFDEKIWNLLGLLTCNATIIVCYLHQTDVDLQQLSELLQVFDDIHKKVENNLSWTSYQIIKSSKEIDLSGVLEDNIVPVNSFYGNNESLTPYKDKIMSNHYKHPQTSLQVVGFQNDEVTILLDQLTRGSKQLRVVQICGMGGIGKTTFALKLYNHPSVMSYFHARAWCFISEVMDKKKVLLSLLEQIRGENYSLDMSEDDLANKLRQSLKGKRYMIFLDDVWTTEAWNNLNESFPDDCNQSRIFLTSRHRDIIYHGFLINEEPYSLRLREDRECLDILKEKLFPKSEWPLELIQIGLKFAEKCKGLPLTVVLVAGLLATTKQESWEKILDALSLGPAFQITLELSYKNLPVYLQPCFLYFGAFPENEELSVTRLIKLWVSEGFLIKNESKKMKDVAREYLDDMIQRSLVMVSQNGSRGSVKTCRIHDLVHGFCGRKAKKENLFHFLEQRHDQLSDFNAPNNLRRLFIQSDPFHLKKSGLFCPSARSLVFFYTNVCFFDMTFIIQIFKQLVVLDIVDMGIIVGIPREIDHLIQLKYLSVRSSVPIIPASIGNLLNLETLIIMFLSSEEISFPQTLWNLEKLKHLKIKNNIAYGFSLPVENLETSPILLELESISGVIFYSGDGSMEKLMRKFPNIRKLNCSIRSDLASTKESNRIVIPDFLCLESLAIFCTGKLKFDFYSRNENLRKVTLAGFEMSREEIEVIGNLPNLEVLQLWGIHFLEGTLEMEEGEFLNLRLFKVFDGCNGFRKWITSDDQLPRLVTLVLISCTKLEEIPSSCLEDSSTIEEIRLVSCSDVVKTLVSKIEELQKDSGNLIKVQFYRLEEEEEEEEEEEREEENEEEDDEKEEDEGEEEEEEVVLIAKDGDKEYQLNHFRD